MMVFRIHDHLAHGVAAGREVECGSHDDSRRTKKFLKGRVWEIQVNLLLLSRNPFAVAIEDSRNKSQRVDVMIRDSLEVNGPNIHMSHNGKFFFPGSL